jgi:hypothetical protein
MENIGSQALKKVNYRATIPDAIRSDDTEAEFEKRRDLVSPANREIGKAMSL